MRRCWAGEEGARAACLDCGQVAGFEARGRVAHAENTAMNGDQPAGGHSLLDLVPCETRAEQLLPSDDAVRAPGEPGKDFVDGAGLSCHWRP